MMARREVIGDCELWCGDCRDLLGEIPDDACVISDPPYGINFRRNDGGKGIWERRGSESIAGDDVEFDPAPLLRFHDCVLWGANHYAHRLPKSAGWLIWDKKLGLKEDDFSDGEVAWHKRGTRLRIYRRLWNGLLAHEQGERRVHIMQKPVALMEWCLGFVDGETIADPFMGSGTCGVACVRLGRPFIGVEIDAGHYETALRRIARAYRQRDLFIEPPPKPVQLALEPA